MAIMEPTQIINVAAHVNMTEGEWVCIQVLNPDMSVKQELYKACVPTGKIVSASTSFYGTLVDA